MRATLREEIARFLVTRGASTASQVAVGVRARRADVDSVLGQKPFRVVPPPDGGSPRARYFHVTRNASQLVLATHKQPQVRPTPRAELLLQVLADGAPHTRTDIFTRTGQFFLTNNAASELRNRGIRIRQHRASGEYVYQLQEEAA